ncbi:hypothetical protein NUSPORA_02592 [Nucleospora cyclopteri]
MFRRLFYSLGIFNIINVTSFAAFYFLFMDNFHQFIENYVCDQIKDLFKTDPFLLQKQLSFISVEYANSIIVFAITYLHFITGIFVMNKKMQEKFWFHEKTVVSLLFGLFFFNSISSVSFYVYYYRVLLTSVGLSIGFWIFYDYIKSIFINHRRKIIYSLFLLFIIELLHEHSNIHLLEQAQLINTTGWPAKLKEKIAEAGVKNVYKLENLTLGTYEAISAFSSNFEKNLILIGNRKLVNSNEYGAIILSGLNNIKSGSIYLFPLINIFKYFLNFLFIDFVSTKMLENPLIPHFSLFGNSILFICITIPHFKRIPNIIGSILNILIKNRLHLINIKDIRLKTLDLIKIKAMPYLLYRPYIMDILDNCCSISNSITKFMK